MTLSTKLSALSLAAGLAFSPLIASAETWKGKTALDIDGQETSRSIPLHGVADVAIDYSELPVCEELKEEGACKKLVDEFLSARAKGFQWDIYAVEIRKALDEENRELNEKRGPAKLFDCNTPGGYLLTPEAIPDSDIEKKCTAVYMVLDEHRAEEYTGRIISELNSDLVEQQIPVRVNGFSYKIQP